MPKEMVPDSSFVLVHKHRRNNSVQVQWAPVGEKAAKLAREKGLICECETLLTGEIALYCHFPNEEDYGCEIAKNGPGEPGKVLAKMILEKATKNED